LIRVPVGVEVVGAVPVGACSARGPHVRRASNGRARRSGSVLIFVRFAELGHGDKRVPCAAALLWYFTTEPEVRRLYREWARAIAEGFATIEEPPDTVAAILAQRSPKLPRAKKTGKR